MWPFSRKPKRVVVKRYKAFSKGGAQKSMEKDANRMARRGYRVMSMQDKGHLLGPQRGEVIATYELVERT
jgi:hypothetical protein